MKLSRRGLLGAFLAAPAIIRTAGLLMPIKPSLADGVALTAVSHPINTDDLPVSALERYEIGWSDWRGMWGNDPGDMAGFELVPIKAVRGQPNSPRDANVDLAYARMRELRRLEAEIVDVLNKAHAFPT